jgi:hypothetical protein
MHKLIFPCLLFCLSSVAQVTPAEPKPEGVPLSAYRDAAEAFLEKFPPYEKWKDFCSIGQEEREEDREELAECSQKTTVSLLQAIKDEPYGMGHGIRVQVLKGRKAEAADLLMKEMAGAEDYYLDCLVDILAEMPSEQRDRLFAEKLNELAKSDEDSLGRNCLEPMIDALAANRAVEAVETLRRLAANPGLDRDVRGCARVALNVLGKPEFLNSSGYSVVSGANASKAQEESRRLVAEVMKDLLLQGLLTPGVIPSSGAFEVQGVAVKEGVTTAKGALPRPAGEALWEFARSIVAKGPAPKRVDKWQLALGKPKQGKIPVYYECVPRPMAARGYWGLIEKRDGRWVCVFWQMVWMS